MTTDKVPNLKKRHQEVAGEVAIDVQGLSKYFMLDSNNTLRLLKGIFSPKAVRKNSYKAVDNVNFTIMRGEVVGIVGPNGAGKTTLLKIIAGLLASDEGKVTVNGSLAAMLALGVCAHPEFSGRENIFYSGLILGMEPEEISKKIQGIIDFAELGMFIDQPFRTYSSGMRARLLFSISTSVEPDILIVDEALSSGDAYFMQKCQRRISEICNSGRTVLLVSHNQRQIEELCERCLVMKNGRLIFDGPTQKAMASYIDLIHDDVAAKVISQNAEGLTVNHGTGEVIVDSVSILQANKRTPTVYIGEDFSMLIDCTARHQIQDVTVTVLVHSMKTTLAYAFVQPFDYSATDAEPETIDLKEGRNRITLDLSGKTLGDGIYTCTVFISQTDTRNMDMNSYYASYIDVFSFNAAYRNGKIFNRGTLSEIPVRSISVS